ncbi:hypothetical protein CB1_000427010 [Camelus ferus]|nr:hypothetical protein CB1_000427010 [Camelus ferus]
MYGTNGSQSPKVSCGHKDHSGPTCTMKQLDQGSLSCSFETQGYAVRYLEAEKGSPAMVRWLVLEKGG